GQRTAAQGVSPDAAGAARAQCRGRPPAGAGAGRAAARRGGAAMTRAGGWLRAAALRAHAAMVWLYPRAFTGEFGEEMRADFALSLAEAAGWRGAGRVLVREARDWPGSLWSAH